jgi:hypothetical protein
MTHGSAKSHFLKRLKAGGLALDKLTLGDGVAAALSFYEEERAEGCDIDQDGDMLLFEWGTFDWGDGPAFEVSVARQLIATGDEDDEPRQLRLTFRFKASAAGTVRSGNRWCESPDVLPAFRKFINRSSAFKAIGETTPTAVELRYGRT